MAKVIRPVRSMTGFGAARLEGKGLTVEIEIRAVNHRYLQLKTRLGGDFSALEHQVEALVRTRVSRGSLSVRLSVELSKGGSTRIDHEMARCYQQDLVRLAEELNLPPKIDLSLLVGLP